jgi:hypothetical protein
LQDLLKPNEIPDALSGEKERVLRAVNQVDPERRIELVAILPAKS